MSRTGLSPADIAKSFRDRCGDGSVEWTYTPTQTWVLLDAADMLDENAKLREELADMPKCAECEAMFKCEECEAMLDCDECLRADSSQKERKRVDYENAKLRELAERAWKTAERLCQAFEGPCRDDGVTIVKPCPMGERDEECVYGQLQSELRECGVEVDA